MTSKGELNFIQRAIAPLARRIFSIVGRAVIDSVSDGEKIQLLKISLLAGEVKDAVERFQQYGFTAVPFPEAEALCLFPNGNRDHGIVIAVDDRRFRKTDLKPGEVAVYSFNGDYILFKQDKTIEINTAKAIINSPQVEIGVTALEKVLKGETFQSTFNNHTHVGNLGSPTSPPIVPSTPLELSLQVKAG